MTAQKVMTGLGASLALMTLSGAFAAVPPTVSYTDIKNPEDIAPIGKTGFAIVSSFAPASEGTSGYYALNLESGALAGLTAEYPADAGEAECAPPLEAPVFAHGIDVRHKTDNYYELLGINHGGREAVEIYEMTLDDEGPSLVWVSCVMLPAEISPNDVTALPDGAFAVSSFGMKNDPQSVEKILRGDPTGAIVEWSPKGGWHYLDEGTFSGPNGILASPDGTELFIAAWGTSDIMALSRKDGTIRQVTESLDFHPDNLSMTADGKLVVAGQLGDADTIWACVIATEPRCGLPGKVASIDTVSGEQTTLIETGDAYSAVSIGLVTEDSVWVGAFHDDRLARFSRK